MIFYPNLIDITATLIIIFLAIFIIILGYLNILL